MKTHYESYLFLVAYFANILNGLVADKILFVYPIATRSETHLFLPIVKSLAEKGHSITVLTPILTQNLSYNIEQIVPTTPMKDTDFMLTLGVLEERRFTKYKFTYLMSFDPTSIFGKCHTIYQNEDFQKLITSRTRSFDLIVMSGFFNNCFEPLANIFGVPYILMTSMPTPHWIASRTGFRMPPSFVPVPIIDHSSKMDFWERSLNTIIVWLLQILTSCVINPEVEKIYRQYLGNDFPGISEIEKNVSFIMSNSHFSVNSLRPAMPDFVEVGGIHCRHAKTLPKDLNNFVTEAKHGVIYFSLGSVVQTETFPDEWRKTFLKTFSKLKENVLWKWSNDTMDDLPPNVKLVKWLPQQDILGHPNVKLFISHAGLLSTQETIYHGVPMLAIPLFVDQDINARQAELNGFALMEESLEMTEESLRKKINRLLTEPSFAKAAKKMSTIFKDQLQTPLERATYWIEYVLHHKGAPHLRSPAMDLNFIQYHSFDVIALLVFITTCIVGSVAFIILRFCCGKRNIVDDKLNSLNVKKD